MNGLMLVNESCLRMLIQIIMLHALLSDQTYVKVEKKVTPLSMIPKEEQLKKLWITLRKN